MSALSSYSVEAQEQVFDRMINLSRADRQAVVSIFGPQSLELASLLCRRDFSHVQCAIDMTSNVANDPSDVLILSGELSGPELARRLHDILHWLGREGVIVARLKDLDDDLAVEAALRTEPCEVASTVFDLSHEVLVAHRITRTPGATVDLAKAS